MGSIASIVLFFLKLAAGLGAALLVAISPIGVKEAAAPSPTSIATSTASLASSTTTTAVTPAKTPAKTVHSVSTSSSSATAPAATETRTLTPIVDSETVNAKTRGALVNILCTIKTGGAFSNISGSGVFVSSAGVVLTNAHIGQYFLLRDYGIKDNIVCTLRMGSPARNVYTARLLYLPPAWIDANAHEINQEVRLGTGENDYAFLLVTGMTNPNASTPASFPAPTLTLDEPYSGDGMLLAAYPAGFLDGITIETNLYTSSAFSTAGTLYSFTGTSRVDLFSIGGTVVAQAGSSGGAVARLYDGALNGIIVTTTTGDTTASRDLRAITLSHIDRSLAAAGQGGIAALLSGDLTKKANWFDSSVAPDETAALLKELSK